MELVGLKKCTDWFRVVDFKSLTDPTGLVARKEVVVSLDQYPYDFGLGPNPREPRFNNRVSKRIAQTLEAGEERPNFHLLNRGITVVAKDIRYDNKNQRVRITLGETDEEERYFGILDGGNTNARINQWREALPEDEAGPLLTNTY
ncbi:unnamed protein product, partial [marine sediment metagenome]